MVGFARRCRRQTGWVAGEVVAVPYREPQFGPGFLAPYQVRLLNLDQTLIYCPTDSDECIRAAPGTEPEPPAKKAKH